MTSPLKKIQTPADANKIIEEQRTRLLTLARERENLNERMGHEDVVFDDAKIKKIHKDLFENELERANATKRIEFLEKQRDVLLAKEKEKAIHEAYEAVDAAYATVAELFRTEYIQAARTIAMILALEVEAATQLRLAHEASDDAQLEKYKKIKTATQRLDPAARRELFRIVNLPNPLNSESSFWNIPADYYMRSVIDVTSGRQPIPLDIVEHLAALTEAANPAELLKQIIQKTPMPKNALCPAPPENEAQASIKIKHLSSEELRENSPKYCVGEPLYRSK